MRLGIKLNRYTSLGCILTVRILTNRPYLNKKSDAKVLRYSQDWCIILTVIDNHNNSINQFTILYCRLDTNSCILFMTLRGNTGVALMKAVVLPRYTVLLSTRQSKKSQTFLLCVSDSV